MKHAFLIIAHNEYKLLSELIRLLDHENNDIFLHIDKKAKEMNINELYCIPKKSKIIIRKEISVLWGDESQVRCEMLLLNDALKGSYDYYHFLSGVDLPIKSMKHIHLFFEENRGKEFIHFDSRNVNEQVISRVLYRHYLSPYLKRFKSKIITKLLFMMDNMIVKFQKVLKMKRKLEYKIIQKGCNWCSITNEFAKYIVKQEEKIYRFLKYSRCGDELFIQTICANSKYINNLYRDEFDNDYDSCKRLIIWDDKYFKSPKTYTINDFEYLCKSSCLFGRKFSIEKEEKFTRKWIDYIKRLEDEN